MPQGIRDKVAILGMGCSKFGERWDAGPDDLMVEAYLEAMQDAGIEEDHHRAVRAGTAALTGARVGLRRDGNDVRFGPQLQNALAVGS